MSSLFELKAGVETKLCTEEGALKSIKETAGHDNLPSGAGGTTRSFEGPFLGP